MSARAQRSLEERIEELEARSALHALVARYSHAVDDRDLATVMELFAPDGCYVHKDDFTTQGREELERFYRDRLSEYGPTFHYIHTQIVDFTSPTEAVGIVSAHAEMAIDDRCVLAGIRYDDAYTKVEGDWKIGQRAVSFRYALPWNDVDGRYADKLRRRWRGVASEPHLPEKLESWQAFYAE